MTAATRKEHNMRHVFMWHVILMMMLLFSAFSVVYVKDLKRRLFIAYQQRVAMQEQLFIQWSQLLLEQSTLARQERIGRVASNRLHMYLPGPKQVMMMKLKTRGGV